MVVLVIVVVPTLTPVTPENVTKSPSTAPLEVEVTSTIVVPEVNENTTACVVDIGVMS
jgi:hypothetical protein